MRACARGFSVEPVTVAATMTLNGLAIQVPLTLDADALATIAAALGTVQAAPKPTQYLSVAEAAEVLRAKRARVDDLLSQGRLTRHKDGARTLIERAELERYLRAR